MTVIMNDQCGLDFSSIRATGEYYFEVVSTPLQSSFPLVLDTTGKNKKKTPYVSLKYHQMYHFRGPYVFFKHFYLPFGDGLFYTLRIISLVQFFRQL